MEENTFTAALAGLLQGIGGPKQIAKLIPTALLQRAEAKQSIAQLAATLLNTHPPDVLQPVEAILASVDLGRGELPKRKILRPGPLTIDGDSAYPVADQEAANSIRGDLVWKNLADEMTLWKTKMPRDWDTQSDAAFFITFLGLIRKHLWAVAGSEKDVSLYEQSRLISALSACLSLDGMTQKPDVGKPVVHILRGDISGIQNFIFRITQPGAQHQQTAKRLRGRSFYLSLLSEVTVDWLLRSLDLPNTCALFVGGGRFDILLPSAAFPKTDALFQELQNWLLEEFYGEIGLQTAYTDFTVDDFSDARAAYARLEDGLKTKKHQKWAGNIEDLSFFLPQTEQYHTCNVCQLTPTPEPKICSQCSLQKTIGENLPHTVGIAYFYGEGSLNFSAKSTIDLRHSPFNVRIVLLEQKDNLDTLRGNRQAVVYRLNDTDFIQPNIASSFRFFANTAPLAIGNQHFESGLVPDNDVLHFDAIASLSRGVKRLGILKADVDYLGLVMSAGLENPKTQAHPTITRLSSLSTALDLFFSGLLNRICDETTLELRPQAVEKEYPSNGLFYILYSGGDDLFIVGPWNGVLTLAANLEKRFRVYCGDNPNMSISAGYVQVKPRFPVHKFAELVDEAESQAKNEDRNRISAFGQVMVWHEERGGYVPLMEFSNKLEQAIANKDVNRSLLADLGQLHRQYDTGEKALNPMWTPQLYYTLSRRLNKTALEHIGRDIINAMRGNHILFPVSVVSLITRKEK